MLKRSIPHYRPHHIIPSGGVKRGRARLRQGTLHENSGRGDNGGSWHLTSCGMLAVYCAHHDMAELTVERFEEGMESFAKIVKEGFDATASKVEVEGLHKDLKADLRRIEALMVTKSYLDEKLFILKGDLIEKLRKTNEKLDFVVALLRARSILSDDDLKRIRSEFQIFPSLST